MSEVSHRKVYMRGFFDGLTAQQEKTMNEARFNSIYRGMSAVAQKVFGAVPANEAWSASQIHGELMRKGHSIQQDTIRGCLKKLVESGIASEPVRGTFIRNPIREAYKAPPEPKAIQPSEEKEEDVTTTAIDKLTAISSRARSIAGTLNALAEDIDNAAIELDSEIVKAGEGAERLKQLQVLLKGLV